MADGAASSRSRRPARPSARRSGTRSASSSGSIPGSTRTAVRFQVVSEGERGLLGVGYAPARVIATAPEAPPAGKRRDDERGGSARARARRAHHRRARDPVPDRRRGGRRDASSRPAPGRDLGMLIGKHGQTIDAIQYLVNAILARRSARSARRSSSTRPATAPGGRRRSRRSRSGARSRRSRPGCAVELDPMTAVERKVVHLRLKEFAGRRDDERGHGAQPLRRRPSRRRSDGRAARALAGGRARDAGLTALRDAGRGAAGAARGRAARRSSSSRALGGPRSSTSAPAAARRGSRSPPRCPDVRVTLLEAERRKADFLRRWEDDVRRTCTVVWGRAEEQAVGAVRRRGREGARAAGRGRGVVPAARPRGRRGRALGRPERGCGRGVARRGRALAGELVESPPGFLVAAQAGPDAAGLPAPAGHRPQAARCGRDSSAHPAADPGPSLSDVAGGVRADLRAREPEGRRRQDDDGDQPRRVPRRGRRARARDRPRPAGERDLGARRARERDARPTTCSTASPLAALARPTRFPNLDLVPATPGARRRRRRARAPRGRRPLPRRGARAARASGTTSSSSTARPRSAR